MGETCGAVLLWKPNEEVAGYVESTCPRCRTKRLVGEGMQSTTCGTVWDQAAPGPDVVRRTNIVGSPPPACAGELKWELGPAEGGLCCADATCPECGRGFRVAQSVLPATCGEAFRACERIGRLFAPAPPPAPDARAAALAAEDACTLARIRLALGASALRADALVEEVKRLKALETARFISVGCRIGADGKIDAATMTPVVVDEDGDVARIPRDRLANPDARPGEAVYLKPREDGPGLAARDLAPKPVDERPWPSDEDLLA